jgi:hypothetical protein
MNLVVWLSNLFYATPVISLVSFFRMDSYSTFFKALKLDFSPTFSTFNSSPTINKDNSSEAFSMLNYSSSNQFSDVQTKYSFLEHESLSRFSRFSNPTISYDFKCGNYIGI